MLLHKKRLRICSEIAPYMLVLFGQDVQEESMVSSVAEASKLWFKKEERNKKLKKKK